MNFDDHIPGARHDELEARTLSEFRRLATVLAGPEPQDWQWIGPHMSQRMFGISEARARDYATRHGGTASKM